MHDRGDLPELTDGVVLLRPLTLSDAQSWHEGDDEEARRWFQFPPERELPWAQRSLDIAVEASAAERDVLLHGDLHHENILAARERYVAIDPKGVLGNPEWEVAPFLFNNLPRDHTGWRRVIRRRADQIADGLGLERSRLYAFSATRALQSAFWSLR